MDDQQQAEPGYLQTVAFPPRCPTCGCTERGKYHNTLAREIRGVDPAGNRYTRVTWKRTQCKQCGQRYTVRFYDQPAEPSAAKPPAPKTSSATRRTKARKAKTAAVDSKHGRSDAKTTTSRNRREAS